MIKNMTVEEYENSKKTEETEGRYRVKEEIYIDNDITKAKMKVFISQPMRGRTIEQIEERRDQICELVVEVFNRDIEFIDSINKDPELQAKGSVAMLGHSISLMADADLVVMDDCEYGYSGVYIEREVASAYQIPKIDIFQLCNLYAAAKGMVGSKCEDFTHKVCSYYNSKKRPERSILVGDDVGIVADAVPKPCKEDSDD